MEHGWAVENESAAADTRAVSSLEEEQEGVADTEDAVEVSS